jgi:hypothetical protein
VSTWWTISVLVAALFGCGAPDGAARSSVTIEEAMTPVLVLEGRQLLATDARVALATTDGATTLRVEVAPEPDEPVGLVIEVVRAADGDSGSFRRGDAKGAIADTAEVAQMREKTAGGAIDAAGLQLVVLWPLRSPFVRQETVLIAFQDTAVAETVARAFLPPAAGAGGPRWTLESATRFVASELRSGPGVTRVEITAAGDIEVERVGGGTQQIHLGNVAPDLALMTHDEGRQRLLSFALIPDAHPPVTRDRVMLRVVPGPAPVTVDLPGGGSDTLASIPVADDLTAVFVHDRPDAMLMLTEAQMLAIEPVRDAWLPLAQANVLRELREVRIRGWGVGPYMLTCGGNYENALALLPETWDVMRPLVGEHPLAAIQARDLFFLHADQGADSREALADHLARLPNPAYAISQEVYQRAGPGISLRRP